jgi:hypothetical protein
MLEQRFPLCPGALLPFCPVAFLEKAKVSLKRKGFLKKQRFLAQAKVSLKRKGFLKPNISSSESFAFHEQKSEPEQMQKRPHWGQGKFLFILSFLIQIRTRTNAKEEKSLYLSKYLL